MTLRLLGGTTAQWAAASTRVLAAREIGLETTIRNFKVGDGVTPWSELPYWITEGGGGSPVEGIEDVPGLQEALDALANEDGALDAGLSSLSGTVASRWPVTAIYDALLEVDSERPPVDTNQRVMWPVSREPSVAVAGGVLTPTLGGAPVNAGPNDTYDPKPDIFQHTLTGNVQIANLLAAGGGALGAADAGRTGYFQLTQDGTGGRGVTIDGASHYTLLGVALGGGGALPIQTAAGAITVVMFHIVSPSLVHLVISNPVT